MVTEAWTEALMFRGFEIILRGKDPQAGLIMTPRICGICGGSHLYKACFAIDTAWKTVLPPNAITVRNIAQACETLQSIPRWFYALFAIDLVNKKYAKAKDYDEAMRRFAPFVGESYEPGVVLGAKPVEVYAIFGGQWPHSSFMIPGGVMCAPTLTDITRSIAILDYWRQEWLENQFLGCSIERYRQIADVRAAAGVVRRERVAAQQRPRVLHPLRDGHRPRQVRRRLRQLPRDGHVLRAQPVRDAHRRWPQQGADHAVGHLLRRRPTTRSTTCG